MLFNLLSFIVLTCMPLLLLLCSKLVNFVLFLKQEEVKMLRAHVEEVTKENKSLHDEMAKSGGLRQEDW